jgi:thiamine-phosphate pyrophosphorylase
LPSLPRLYAILDLDTLAARGLDARLVVDAWLDAGIRLIQLRAKSTPSGALLTLASELARAAQGAGAQFLVNDRADIALMSGADGVHVGQSDLSPTMIKALNGHGQSVAHIETEPHSRRPFLVGLSTHTLDQFRRGLSEPADYLAIGPVFPSRTKTHADPAVGLETVTRAAAITGRGRPLVAIGGITLALARSVLEAGADSVAVISGLLNDDIGILAREFVANCL